MPDNKTNNKITDNKKIDVSYIERLLSESGIDVYGILGDNDFYKYYADVKAYHENSPTEFCDYDVMDRLSLKSVVENAKSAIVIAVPYELINDKTFDKKVDSLYGIVSNGAWEFDYHILIKSILNDVLDKLVSEYAGIFDIVGEISADTSPMIDRILAKESGIGLYGRNTCIINERYGTSFYIGTLILNAAIDVTVDDNTDLDKINMLISDSDFGNGIYSDIKCVKCSKCVELCPGNALNGDYTMNVSKCISYLTQKKVLDFDEMEKIGTRVYGCDVCQVVCPYNKDRRESIVINERFKRNTPNQIDLMEVISLSNKELQRRYRSSGFIWRGPKIIKRNCMIGIGNYKSSIGLEFIVNNIDKFNDELAKTALWSIFRIDSKFALKYLDEQGNNLYVKYTEYIELLKQRYSV